MKEPEHKVSHATFTIERQYNAPPARVFAAWATQEQKTRWFVGPDNWQKSDHTLDFREGGKESLSGGPPGGAKHYYNAVYQDIVPGERFVICYQMHMDKTRISVSLATVELKAERKGTRLLFTEQSAFLDGYDDAGSREKGTRDLLDNLEKFLAA